MTDVRCHTVGWHYHLRGAIFARNLGLLRSIVRTTVILPDSLMYLLLSFTAIFINLKSNFVVFTQLQSLLENLISCQTLCKSLA